MGLPVHSSSIFAQQALLPDGWRKNVRLEFDANGCFTAILPDSVPVAGSEHVDVLMPPLPSLHSHAFQRAMAGLTEKRLDPADSFWTWRDQMYRLAARVDPEALQAISAQLYMEMLKSGFTQVAEFHYLHHAPDGTQYENPAEMSQSVVEGALQAGIGMTILPTLYCHAGFGQKLAEGQKRFGSTPEFIAQVISNIGSKYSGNLLVTAGMAIHSLRAASGDDIHKMLALVSDKVPVHIHIAEQVREVEDCLSALGRRPVQWLLDEFPVDHRWCLVHATHLDDRETVRLARSGAVAGLCPITEANLGDGIFPLSKYIDEGGKFGIGTDSNVLLSAMEELRTLEYGQRLFSRKRCRSLPSEATGSVGDWLYQQALHGGSQACAHGGGRLAVGERADALSIRRQDLSFPDLEIMDMLDSLIFTCPSLPVHHVLCAGKWVIRDGRHIHEAAINRAYQKAITTLRS